MVWMLRFITYVKFMPINFFRLGLVLVFISVTQLTVAQVSDKQSTLAQTELLLSADKGIEFQLQVKQLPLAQVLANIVSKTKIAIHYSVLPEGLVTATCVGSSLKQVLECLLDGKADLIVRYQSASDKIDHKDQIAEAWILGSNLADVVAKVECPALIDKGSLTFKQNEDYQLALTAETEALLKAAQSNKPEDRIEAMSRLLVVGAKGDPAVKAALEQGLIDKDESVRAQAISSYSRREGSGAATALQEALHDPSMQVRLMAVDGITDNTALLQQAINDNDETIRALATTKLEALTQTNNN